MILYAYMKWLRLTVTFTTWLCSKNLRAIDYVMHNWKIHGVFQLLHCFGWFFIFISIAISYRVNVHCTMHTYLVIHTHTYTHAGRLRLKRMCNSHFFEFVCSTQFSAGWCAFYKFYFSPHIFDINIEGCLGKLPDAHCTSKRKHQKLNQNLGLRITLPTTKLFQQFFFFLCCAKNHSFFSTKNTNQQCMCFLLVKLVFSICSIDG